MPEGECGINKPPSAFLKKAGKIVHSITATAKNFWDDEEGMCPPRKIRKYTPEEMVESLRQEIMKLRENKLSDTEISNQLGIRIEAINVLDTRGSYLKHIQDRLLREAALPIIKSMIADKYTTHQICEAVGLGEKTIDKLKGTMIDRAIQSCLDQGITDPTQIHTELQKKGYHFGISMIRLRLSKKDLNKDE
jgi:hypothetical protein